MDNPRSRIALNAFIGFIVGLAGGLVGLGGAELRLPYLAGKLRLPLKTAIPINLAVSLLTLLAALPTRLYTLNTANLKPFAYETAALGLGAVFGAYVGVSWLRRLSPMALKRAVFALLLALGLVMIAESVVVFAPSRRLAKYDTSQNCLRGFLGLRDRCRQWASEVWQEAKLLSPR